MKCGCERGVNCTRTTMCALQSAVEDATEPLLERIAELEKDVMARTNFVGWTDAEKMIARNVFAKLDESK